MTVFDWSVNRSSLTYIFSNGFWKCRFMRFPSSLYICSQISPTTFYSFKLKVRRPEKGVNLSNIIPPIVLTKFNQYFKKSLFSAALTFSFNFHFLSLVILFPSEVLKHVQSCIFKCPVASQSNFKHGADCLRVSLTFVN